MTIGDIDKDYEKFKTAHSLITNETVWDYERRAKREFTDARIIQIRSILITNGDCELTLGLFLDLFIWMRRN
jgi:hypothetical protein